MGTPSPLVPPPLENGDVLNGWSLSEPSSTTITYQFGDDGEKIEFPMITMCAPSQLYETAFQNACGLSEEVMFYDFLSVRSRVSNKGPENLKT